MPRKEETTICEFCRKGHVHKRKEDIAFRQWSDIGRISCQVTVSMGVCDGCGARSGSGIDKIFDEAFQREYDKQRIHRAAPRYGAVSGATFRRYSPTKSIATAAVSFSDRA
jgi:hypothetical protein